MWHFHSPAAGHRARVCGLAGLLALCVAGAAQAATISGTVKNEANVGQSNVDVDFIDICTGDNIFLSGDHTAADGTFSIVVPNGNYDVHFIPPAGSTVCANDLQDVTVSANANLGSVVLHPGRLVSGTVQTPSLGPAANVDLKFVSAATEERVFLTKEVTNSSGQYSVRVPPGTWTVDYRPAAATSFTDAQRTNLVVGAADISGLVNVLGSGFVISGTVRDKNNNRVKNVDIDVYDSCTGVRLATAHDNTDANGNYSICLPAGTYTINYDPPFCKALESVRSTAVTVDRNKNIGTEQLKSAVLVSGTVLNDLGAPLADAKIKFYDVTAAGAPRQPATNDRTNAAGIFNVYVPPGTYDINIEPPVGTLDVVGHINAVGAGFNVNIGTTQLAAGHALSGHVVGPGNVPKQNVNINVVDAVTRVALRLAHDDTDAAGNFTVVVPAGTFDVQYDPPGCSGLAPTSQNQVTVAAPLALPTLTMTPGVSAQGSVVGTLSAPVPNVDLDFYPAGTTTKIYTPNDQTAADGTYSTVVPTGTYDIRYIPSSLTRYRPFERTGVALNATQTLPLTALVEGLLVTGTVLDGTTFLPVVDATLEFYVPGASTPTWTTHHQTDALGAYSVAIDAGTWDILYTPPAGSNLAPAWQRGVVIAADTALPNQLLSRATGVGEPGDAGPLGLALAAPWPNPAQGFLNLSFAAPHGQAELAAWDVVGRKVATLWRGESAAPLDVRWNFTNDAGESLASGVYYVRLTDRTGAAVVRRVVRVR